MAVTFYVGSAGHESFEIDVPDPGHGRLVVRRLDHRFGSAAKGAHDAGEYAGAALAELLGAVTGLATGTVDDGRVVVRSSVGRSLVVARDEAAALLPQLQKAVALSVGVRIATSGYGPISTPGVWSPSAWTAMRAA